MKKHAGPFRTRPIVVLLMAIAVLVPSLYGFGTKFLEFIALYRGDADGAFAISPILNYLFASAGFLFLFGWAALGGMFHDIEQPKITFLENEALLDQEANLPWRNIFDNPRSARIASDRNGATPRTLRFRDHYDHD